MKGKFDNVLKIYECKLFGDRDKTGDHIIIECKKQSQKKYKSISDWMVKAIHWVLCKRQKFHYTDQMTNTQTKICSRK